MIALRVLLAGALAAGAISLSGAPLAQAEPPMPDQEQILSSDPGDPLCRDTACQAPPQAAPPPIRGVLGCKRGVCIPKPIRPRTPQQH